MGNAKYALRMNQQAYRTSLRRNIRLRLVLLGSNNTRGKETCHCIEDKYNST